MNLPHYWIMPDILYREDIKYKVKQVVCEHMGIKLEDIVSEKRHKNIVNSRFMASAIYHQCLGMKLKDIARQFNRFEHSTVVHSLQKHRDYMEFDYEYRSNYQAIKNRLVL